MTKEKAGTYLEVLQPGILTTVQDRGRFGYQQFGFSQSGVMDRRSYELGNRLLGNGGGEAALEMAWLGLTVRFAGEATLVLTGAPMPAKQNGRRLRFGEPFEVGAGDVLEIGAAERGRFAYLCAAGGIDVPLVMGSRSTNLRCSVGGFEGRRLRCGDWLRIGAAGPRACTSVPEEKAVETAPSAESVVLRIVPDGQEERFLPEGIRSFYTAVYTVTEESDRMGYRLAGEAVASSGRNDILSEGIALGAVQVPASGQPIVLTADRQTTGGYAKIGTVFTPDLSVLVQCRPGTGISFRRLAVQEAQNILRERGSVY